MNVISGFRKLALAWLVCGLLYPALGYAQEPATQDNSQVIQAFTSQEKPQQTLEEQTRHLIMFVMGVPLLILLLVTGALGIAMGVYGKQVFVAHMVFAGLSMTLALAHAVVGIVWFYPF